MAPADMIPGADMETTPTVCTDIVMAGLIRISATRADMTDMNDD